MQSTDGTPATPIRMAWVDNLRTFIIMLVVNMHACVTYSHVGSWYVMEQPEPPMSVKIPFVFWQGHLQSFFMGLLFFLSGAFAHKSLQRRGARVFMHERFVRLCLPAFVYMLLIHPLIVFVILRPNDPNTGRRYLDYLASGRVLSGNGPLWFTLALFLFCAALVIVRGLVRQNQEPQSYPVPGAPLLFLFALFLGVATFLVRTVFPIGTDIFNFQLCFFPQYIATFALGVAAIKHDWLDKLATSHTAQCAGLLGLIAGPLLLGFVLKTGGALPENGSNPYAGGWHLQALGLALWEQMSGVALSLGMISLFRRAIDCSGAIAQWLKDRSFAVYVLHAPLLVLLTFALHSHQANIVLKVLILTVTGLAVSFLAADIARRIPGLRSIL